MKNFITKKNICYLLLTLVALFYVSGCGGASAPTTPAQIPTIISMSANEYDGALALQLGRSYLGSVDVSCDDCSATFINSETGEVDELGVCGSASFSDTDFTLTMPNTWQNSLAQCTMQVTTADGSIVPISNTASASISSNPNAKSMDIDFDIDAAESVTILADTSIDIIESGFSITNIEDIVTYADKPSIAKNGTTIYMCYLALDNSYTSTGNIVLATSEDEGETFAEVGTVFTLTTDVNVDLDEYTQIDTNLINIIPQACSIYAKTLNDDSELLVMLVMGPDVGDEDGQIRAVYMQSTDAGATWSDPFVAHASIGSAARNSFFMTISDSGIVYASKGHSESFDEGSQITSAIDLKAYDSTGMLREEMFGENVTVSHVRTAVYESNIYSLYYDKTNGILKLASFTDDGTTITEGTTHSLTAAGDIVNADGVSELSLIVDLNGRPLAVWIDPDDSIGYVTVVDTITDVETYTVTTYEFQTDITTSSGIAAFVSITNNVNFIYAHNGDGAYKLGEFTDEGMRFSTTKHLNVEDIIPDMLDGSADQIGTKFGKFYYVYAVTPGNLYLTKLTLPE